MDKWLKHSWEEDFEKERWHRDGGNFHSLHWMRHVIKSLFQDGTVAEELLALLNSESTIHDYGCAEGDGTMLLQTMFPYSHVVGFDAWPEAIHRARKRWTENNVTWREGDVTTPSEKCDLLISLQTIDHVDDIPATINACREKSNLFVLAWAELAHEDHPSKDLSWKEHVPEPSVFIRAELQRIVWETRTLLNDITHIYAWR